MDKFLAGVLSWLVFVILLIPASILLASFYIYHWIITVFLKTIFRPDLGSPLHTPDFMFSQDLFWKNPSSVIVNTLLVEGTFDLNSLTNRLAHIISSEKHSYDRLSSVYPQFWMGYPFWIKAKQPFDSSNHIKTAEVNRVDPDGNDTKLLLKKMINKPFRKGQPLWDALLITDKLEKRSLLVFRFHHIIGDSVSVIHFVEKLFDEYEENLSDFEQHKPKEVLGIFKTIMVLWMPLTIITHCLHFLHRDYFRVKNSKCKISYARTTLQLSTLKVIRNWLELGVDKSLPLGTLILYLFSTALQKAIIGGELNHVHKDDIIKTDTIVVMPTVKNSAHPRNTFCNHWNHVLYKIPLREEDAKKRLNEMIASALHLSHSRADFVIDQISKANSIFPAGIYRRIAEEIRGTSLLFANVPGPASFVHLFGQKVLSQDLTPGLLFPHSGFVFSCFSYNNQVTFSLIGNTGVMTEKVAKVLLQYFQEEVLNCSLETTDKIRVNA